MESENEHVKHCLLYEFDKQSLVAAACRNVCHIYEEDAMDGSTGHRWFHKFREGDRSCQGQTSNGWPSHFGQDYIDQSIRKSPRQTMEKLAETFNVHWIVKRWLVSSGFTIKLDRWVLHNLTAKNGVTEFLLVFPCFPSSKMTYS
ncbi:histone-lysine N-methyltransferase SETMAR [Trichonephila clavipes]|nr:histone-lysine N-methyltransferase SETMAR [Trichonephila clavipes]